MARIQRMHRVVATYRNGETSEWHYQRPEDAEHRAEILRAGRIPSLNDAERKRHRDAGTRPPMDVPVSVKVQPSHEILWPHEAGDPAGLDLPGMTLSRDQWAEILLDLGVRDPDRALSITWHRGEYVTVELENGKHNPTHWDVGIDNESETNA